MKKKTKVKKKMGCLYSDALYLPKQINNLEIKKTWVESFTVPEIDCSSCEKRTLADEESIESRFCEEFREQQSAGCFERISEGVESDREVEDERCVIE